MALSLFLVFSPLALPLRSTVFDGYQRLFPLEREARHVVVVLIDENSIARYGQWPWPRTRLAELVDAIAKQRPLAIGLDIIFPEPDRFSPLELAAQLPLMPSALAHALEGLPSNDERLAAALRGKPVVLGISAEASADPRFALPPRAAPVRLGAGAGADIPVLPGHIGNIGVIDAQAAGRGVMNSGPQDRVVRMVPLVMDVQGAFVPSLGVETLRVAADSGLSLARIRGGLLRLSFDQVDVKLQGDGQTWLRFSKHDPAAAVPAAGVIAGDVAADTFTNKIVLVGISGLGVLDYKTTPLGEFIPGVNVHGQVIENLLANVSLVRPDAAVWIEAVTLLLCGLVLVLYVPRLSALQGINLALLMVLLQAGGGMLAFLHFGVLLDPAWPALGTFAVFGSVVVGTLSEADRQRRQLREQAARMAGEVDAARRIQMGLLPDPREAVARDPRFELVAALEPARTVGGDFYDCFHLDDRRFFIVVADVSGKGLPAALFMASVKSQLKSVALRGGGVGEMLTRAQADIARENPEQLFVTAFAAILDLETGELAFANAGHEPPFVRTPNGAPERITGAGGPPLCVVEDFAYAESRRALSPGEWLLLVTDGVTEAMNPKREFFGLERLRASLSWLPEGTRAEEVLARVRRDLAQFTGHAEPADDVTLMVLRWLG